MATRSSTLEELRGRFLKTATELQPRATILYEREFELPHSSQDQVEPGSSQDQVEPCSELGTEETIAEAGVGAAVGTLGGESQEEAASTTCT